MAGEGEEDEAAAIELQLEQHLQEQRSSLAAVDEALAADASNTDGPPRGADDLEGMVQLDTTYCILFSRMCLYEGGDAKEAVNDQSMGREQRANLKTGLMSETLDGNAPRKCITP